MSSRVIAALFGSVLAVAACGVAPTAPIPSTAATTAVAAKRKAPQCSDYRPLVAQLISLVDRRTSGSVRTTLLTDLRAAYAALDPAACDARRATAHLQQFIADVKANASSMSSALAGALVSLAQSIIGYLAPFVV